MKSLAEQFLERFWELKSKSKTIQTLPKKVLIVDDDPDYAELLKRQISDEGIEVCVINEADLALKEIIHTRPYDQIFIDLNMPGEMNGVDLLWRIKSLMPNTPTTVISGFIEPEFYKAAEECNIRVLMKPATVEQLKEIL